MPTKAKGVKTYDKAGPNEPIFVLRSQDRFAPQVVREWAFRARRGGASADKVIEALNIADEMETWQTKNPTKVPD